MPTIIGKAEQNVGGGGVCVCQMCQKMLACGTN